MHYILRETGTSLYRSPILTVLSISMISLALYILGLFALGTYNFYLVLNDMEERIQIVAYLRDVATVEDISDLRDILNKYPEAYAKILDDGDIYDNEELYNELFEYCMEDMPYGTQKARDGDPVQWITEHLDYLGLLTKEQTDA